jgi:pimeloyl-ACP methyl ester carboxylesterase
MSTTVPDTLYTTSADGVRIAYQTQGDGPLDVVLLNQLSCIDAMWDDPVFGRSLDRLAKLGRLVIFDLRGHGSSDPVPLGAIPTIDTWSDDVLAVLDCIGSRSAVLIGDGLGGGSLALFFAATHPDRIDRLVLVNTAARWLKADDYEIGHEVEQFSQQIEGRIQAVTATSSLNRSAGVSHSRVLRGRPLRRAAISSSSAWE